MHCKTKLQESVMKNRFNTSSARTAAVIAVLSACATGCGGAKAEGHTYSGNGGVVKIEFKSDGKAFVATGPVSTPCTYSESGKTLTLTCEGDKTDFTVDDDGALIGPPGGMLARLTKEK
jgi:hypothetical protein